MKRRRLINVEAIDDYSSVEEEKDVGIEFEDFMITLPSSAHIICWGLRHHCLDTFRIVVAQIPKCLMHNFPLPLHHFMKICATRSIGPVELWVRYGAASDGLQRSEALETSGSKLPASNSSRVRR
jgi:hypothetical protein